LGIDWLIQGNGWRRLAPAKLHQNGVHRHAIKPRREGGVPTKRTDRAEYLQKSLLGQVLGFSDIFCHEQADGIDAVLVLLKHCCRRRCKTAAWSCKADIRARRGFQPYG